MSYLYFNRYKRFTSTSRTPDPLDAYVSPAPLSTTHLQTLLSRFHQTLALASLSLSTKSTESPRRLRELLLPAHRLLSASSPSAPRLTIPSTTYDALRAALVQAELLLLRVLKFELHVPLALDFLPRYLERTLGEVGEDDYDGLERDHRDEYRIGDVTETVLAGMCRGTVVEA